MAAVESRNRQDVHERENDGKESRHQPEHVPVPNGREKATDGTKTAERLRTVGREEVFQVADIAAEHVPTIFHACGNALKKTIADLRGLVVAQQARHADAELEFGREDDGGGVGGVES